MSIPGELRYSSEDSAQVPQHDFLGSSTMTVLASTVPYCVHCGGPSNPNINKMEAMLLR